MNESAAGTEKSEIQKTLECYGDLLHMCGPHDICSELDNKWSYCIAVFISFAPTGGISAFLSAYIARQSPRRWVDREEVDLLINGGLAAMAAGLAACILLIPRVTGLAFGPC